MRRWVVTAMAVSAVFVGLIAPAHAATSLDADLRTVAGTRVVFGHQSVGWNILDGMDQLYRARGVATPRVVDTLPALGRGFAQREIGSNGNPRSKVRDFVTAVEGSRSVRVAVMKFCFVDMTSGVSARAVFDDYRALVARAAVRRPGVRFVHVTVPLTVNDAASNVVRQRYNQLIRTTYGARVFDLARMESTRPDGTRVTGTWRGQRFYALYRGYAADDGHLNDRGARRVATGFVRALAAAAR